MALQMAYFLFCQTSTSADAANGFSEWQMANFLFCQTPTSVMRRMALQMAYGFLLASSL
jgi:hypothetical protein